MYTLIIIWSIIGWHNRAPIMGETEILVRGNPISITTHSAGATQAAIRHNQAIKR